MKILPIPKAKVKESHIDVSKFCVVKKHHRHLVRSVSIKRMVRDGFDDSELSVPPRFKKKRVARQSPHLPLQGLTLVRAHNVSRPPSGLFPSPALDSLDDTGLASKDHVSPSKSQLQLEVETSLPNLAPSDENWNRISSTQMQGPKCNRRVSYSKEIVSQLISLAAPARMESGSDGHSVMAATSDQSGDDDTERSGQSEEEKGDEDEDEDVDEEQDKLRSPTQLHFHSLHATQSADAEDMIEDNELFSCSYELAQSPQRVSDSIEDDESFGMYPPQVHFQDLYRPGQAGRMRSTGSWNQAQEDIIDFEDNPSSCTTRTASYTEKPLISILKSIVHVAFRCCHKC
jgi:hypothetical protein